MRTVFLRLLGKFPGTISGPDGSDFEYFSTPNYSELAAECNCNRKIPPNVRNLGFFWKKMGFSLERK